MQDTIVGRVKRFQPDDGAPVQRPRVQITVVGHDGGFTIRVPVSSPLAKLRYEERVSLTVTSDVTDND